MRRFGLALLVTTGLVLAGCGSSSDSSLPSKDSGTTETTGATAPGTLYRAPSGDFTMRIGDDWDEINSSPIAWQVGPAGTNGFKPNVNVVITTSTGGGSDSEIVAELRKVPPQVASNSKIISVGPVTLASGEKGYQIEYTGTVQGNALHFYQVFSIGEEKVATVTLTAAQPDFARSYTAARPYILTVNAS